MHDGYPYNLGCGSVLSHVMRWRLLNVDLLLLLHLISHRWHLKELWLMHTNGHIPSIIYIPRTSSLAHSSSRHLHGHQHLILVTLHHILLLIIHISNSLFMLFQFFHKSAILHFQLVFINIVFFFGPPTLLLF